MAEHTPQLKIVSIRFGLGRRINPKASFHYPGATLFLVVTLPEIDVQ